MLDTGVDRRHPALAGRLLAGYDFVDDDNDPSEVGTQADGPYGHGTHVAGLVALAAPEARIMPLRVLDEHGVGNMWVLSEAIRYALDPDGDPLSDDGADVINLSLATVHPSNILKELIGDACDDATVLPTPTPAPGQPQRNAVVVVAAGNGASEDEMFPGAERVHGELSVAASGSDDKLAAFSQRGGWVSVTAPGVGMVSSVPGGGVGTWAGTSMSAPLVAGQAALVRAVAPNKTPEEVEDHIRETAARPEPEQDVKRRVDAAAAVLPLAVGISNPIDGGENFVRQNYLDFLNRAPDAGGLTHWSKEIKDCGADAACVDFKRVNTSAAFFLSIEFRDTGYYVYRMHKAAYGNLPGAPVPVRYEEFMPDQQQLGEGVRVGIGEWKTRLEANKNEYALGLVTSARFKSEFHADMSPGQFVTKLLGNAGFMPSLDERSALISELSKNNTDAGRASVLRKVAEHDTLAQLELNRAFVLMQYFGYLRRNPNSGPNADWRGYDFWLKKLEDHGGDFHAAQMVQAFITSFEYRERFGK